MATITPHRDGVEEAIRIMRQQMPEGTAGDARYSMTRDLTFKLNEAALISLADGRDRNVPDSVIGSAITNALANMLGSVCMTLADLDLPAAHRTLLVMVSHAVSQAEDIMAKAHPGEFAEVDVDEAPTGRA